MMTVTYVVMLYGSGIPILYIIAAAFFFITYWVDKQIVFNHYRKPELYDESMAINTLSWFKYAIVLHLIGGILMYSNSYILPIKDEDMSTSFTESTSGYTDYYSFGSINSVHLSVYIGFIVGIIGLYLIWRIFIQTFTRLARKFCPK
jgi:hypothetical protein